MSDLNDSFSSIRQTLHDTLYTNNTEETIFWEIMATEMKDGAEGSTELLGKALRFLRDAYEDVPPAHRLSSDMNKTNYKVRTTWFMNLCATLDLALDDNLIQDKSIAMNVKRFITIFGPTSNFAGKIRYTRAMEVTVANNIIELVLNYLEGKQFDKQLEASLPEA